MLLFKRLLTSLVLFFILWVALSIGTLAVVGGFAGAQAAEKANARDYRSGYVAGQLAGQEMGRKYGPTIFRHVWRLSSRFCRSFVFGSFPMVSEEVWASTSWTDLIPGTNYESGRERTGRHFQMRSACLPGRDTVLYLHLIRPVKALAFIVAFVGAAPFSFAQTSDSSSSSVAAKVKALAMHAPAPQYPVDAQGRHPTAQGVVLMHVDKKTGRVISAKMQQSTGNKLLDDAAIAAFSQWRFRAGTAAYIRSPITFVGHTQAKPNNALHPTPTPCPVCPSRD